MYPRLILCCSIAALLTFNAGAATIGTFEGSDETLGKLQKSGEATNSGPTIEVGGPTGSFLRLTHEQTGQSNHYVFDATDNDNWSTVTGQFDFRISTVGTDPADGLGFLLIPQSRAGTTGDGLTDFGAEEPNTVGTLALGLDMYQHPGANDVSLHWNGHEQTNAYTAPALLDYVNSGWNRAKVTYTQVGNGMNATVEITKDILGVNGVPSTFTRIEQAIDARPYANRVQLSARTGGAVMTTDVDNVLVQYSGPALALPTIDPGKQLVQDFDSAGASAYVARLHTPDGQTLRVGPKLMGTGGSDGGAYMQLMPDGQNDTRSSLSFTRTPAGGLAPVREMELDFRMANPDGVTPADGMGITLLPTSSFGVAGAGPGLAFESETVANALSIGLRVYNGGPVDRVELRWNNGDNPISVDVSALGLDLDNNQWHRLHVETEAVAGGSNVSLTVIRDVNGVPSNVPVFTNQFVAGMIPYDYRVQVGARSGGLNLQADVDNIRTSVNTGTFVETNNTTVQNFDAQGTFYQATDRHGFDGDTDGSRHAAILGGGPSGNFLRLVHAVNGQNTNVGFNQVIPSGASKPFVEADFDFRMQSDVGINRADGFSFGLFDVNTYGISGPLLDGINDWESKGLTNALTLAFGIYDGKPETTTDFLRLIWNETEIPIFGSESDVFTAFDVNTDLFHHAKLTLSDIGTDTSASLILTQDAFGNATAFPVFENVIIPGLDMDSFDFRAGFGARTGGANADIDIDNVQVVPEPSSAALLLGGLTLLARRRKRRAN